MKNFEGEKSHFGDLFEGMKDINFPENITTQRNYGKVPTLVTRT